MVPRMTIAELTDLIKAARGERPCDLAIRNGYVVNVFTGEIEQADIGIVGDRIAVVSSDNEIEAGRGIDAENLFVTPGLTDSHLHMESSMLTPSEFAAAVLPHGTTAVILDPHEIANVAGTSGIKEMLVAASGLPVKFYFAVPPNIPASDIDTSGARLAPADVAAFADNRLVVGIAEVMDFVSVLGCREDLLEKILSMPGKTVDGHAPGLTGRDLQAYIAAGPDSDHETTGVWEAVEKLRLGMYLIIREGSAAHDLDELAKVVDQFNSGRCIPATDDLLPTDIEEHGHIDFLLKKLVYRGVTPATAVRMATLNPAQRYKLDHQGAIAPGYAADLVAFEDMSDFKAAFVIARGHLVAADGDIVTQVPAQRFSERLTNSIHLPEISVEDISLESGSGLARIIGAVSGQIITKLLLASPPGLAGKVVSDIDQDILKIAVVERHGKSGSVGNGLVHGFGLKSGAIAGSVAHDSHNVVAVGASDSDLLRAIKRIGEIQGGLVVVDNCEVVAELPLPVAGLISLESASTVSMRLREVERAARALGCGMEHPFMTLSFMTLPVVPELKITDKGLVEVAKARIVPLYEDSGRVEGASAS